MNRGVLFRSWALVLFCLVLAANAALNWAKNAKQQKMMKQVNTVCKTIHIYIYAHIYMSIYLYFYILSILDTAYRTRTLLVSHPNRISWYSTASDHRLVLGGYLALRPRRHGPAGSPSYGPHLGDGAHGWWVTPWDCCSKCMNDVCTCIHNWILYI
jgi:hypothetical protein